MASRRAVLVVVGLAVSASLATAGVALADVDGDGLSTLEELGAGTDPLDPDTDDDGLADGPEANEYGTDPTRTHSDRDSLPDGAEVKRFDSDPTAAPAGLEALREQRGTDVGDHEPINTDGDALSDSAELALGTSPTKVDTDGDLLEDGFEFYNLTSNPLKADTDGDGLDDGAEFKRNTGLAVADTDGDGLDDGREVHEYHTNPRETDSDDDGLDDGREVELGTDPTTADTDGDGLRDGRERDVGTDPTDTDTDGDGLPDGAELNRPDVLPDADPLRKDVYVEIDWMVRHRPPAGPLQTVRDRFAQAPVSNPDGSTGVTLHLVWSEAVPHASPLAAVPTNGSLNELAEYRRRYFDRQDAGYHYALFVDNVSSEGQRIDGATMLGEPVVAVERQDTGPETGSTFMHELGHSLGLRGFRGIDSRSLPMSAYPSVMNYNAPPGYYGYSEGTGANDHDDWERINRSLRRVVSTDGFDGANATGREPER